MSVKAIRWLGIQTDRFDEMRVFVVDGLGLTPVADEPDFLAADAANGDRVEVFGPSGPQPTHQFAANRVVAGFLVDDIHAARARISRLPGVELLGELIVLDNGYAWQHFRAPDGQTYELTFDPDA